MVRVLHGTLGNDVLDGDPQDTNVFLDVGAGRDLLTGGANSDRFTLTADLIVDRIDGGAGEDLIDYHNSEHQLRIDLSKGDVFGNFETGHITGWQQVADVRNVEDVIGSRFDDTITGNSADNRLDGWLGNDEIHAGGGNDTLIGGLGNNTLDGGTGRDTADYSNSSFSVFASLTTNQGAIIDTATGTVYARDTYTSIENLTGGRNNDMLIGNTGDNVIDGGDGNDLVGGGGGGNDVLHGGDGDDLVSAVGSTGTVRMFGDRGNDELDASAGTDIVNGGSGTDTVSYALQPEFPPGGQMGNYSFTPGVTVDLTTHTGHGGWAEGDTYEGIENVTGSNFNDTITGDGQVNVLLGGGGNDTLHGGDNDDDVRGGLGDDTLFGDAGNDTLSDLSGRNHFIGGDGTDTADYSSSAASGIVADLTGFFASGTRDAQGNMLSNDDYVGIENVTGSNGTDLIIGNASDNVIIGGRGNDALAGMDGNDTISGGDQNDIIEGGAGADTLDGGTGRNTLSYGLSANGVIVNLAASTATGGDANGDTITNFQNVIGSHGNDTLIGNNDANVFVESAGNNVLFGGGGTDTFVFTENLTGVTQVLDFHVGQDRLAFEGLDGMQDLSFSQTASGTLVHVDGAAGAILLTGVNTMDLLSHAAGEFTFVQTLDPLLA